MTEIYIVRHCESEANLGRSFAGRTDVDISKKGAIQLECLSEYFRDIKLDKVYTTSLLRARKTAQALNKYPKAPMEINDDFIEIDLGELDGKPVADMSDELMAMWLTKPHIFKAPGGEAMKEVAKRAFDGLKAVSKLNDNKTIAIVSHGCAIRNIIRQVKKFGETGLNEIDWCDNTGINKILAFEDEFSLEIENYNGHLSEEAAAIPVSSWTED